jgi:hypothetical protein
LLGKYGCDFNIIPKSKEKYLALTVGKTFFYFLGFKHIETKIRFVDSLHFMPGSLASWASKLENEDFQYISLDKADLRSKQFFPYSYFTKTNERSITGILKEMELPVDQKSWYKKNILFFIIIIGMMT